jgi:transcriptional regulator with XRE-family HTH domain
MKRKMPTMRDSDSDMRQMISDHIQNLRKQKGLSAETVAKKLSMSRSALTQIETGRNNVSAVLIWKLAYLYKCDFKEFFPPTPDEPGLTKNDLDKVESERAKEFVKTCSLNVKNS